MPIIIYKVFNEVLINGKTTYQLIDNSFNERKIKYDNNKNELNKIRRENYLFKTLYDSEFKKKHSEKMKIYRNKLKLNN